MLRSRRWWAATALWLLAYFLIVSFRFPETVHQESSAWDIYLAVMNNWMTVGYLLLPGFVFLISGSIADDMRSGYAWLIVSRASRARWWFGKVMGILLASLVYHAGFIVMTVSFGLVSGYSLAVDAQAQATNSGLMAQSLFPPITSAVNLAIRVSTLLAYEALAFAAIALVLVVLTLKWRRPTMPLAAVVTFEILDWVLSQRVPAVSDLSPGRRLIEGIHFPVSGVQAPETWLASSLYFGTLLLVAYLVGAAYTHRMDF